MAERPGCLALGLPGNPVSTMVCALLFLRPAIDQLAGGAGGAVAMSPAILGVDVGANDNRQDYVRARLKRRSDGVLVATPAGSTAYNFSAMGPILPLGSAVIALTPIAPFRPRRWRGAILRADTQIKLRVLDPYKRPVSVTADSHEVRDVVEVSIREASQNTVTLLFDPEHSLDDRILNEQFTT